MDARRLLAVIACAVGLGPLAAAAQGPGDPRGAVPPPPPAGAPPAPPALRGGEVLTPPPAPDHERAIAATVERFRPLYAAQKSPRIAVYWNRSLTDRLSQWVADRRIVATGQLALMGERQAPTGDTTARLAGSGERTLTEQRLERDPRRPAPSELWGLEFENGFLDPLLRARATVVDRATILRLTAAKTTGTGVGSVGMPDEQTIEVRALQGYADLLVEILVSPAPAAPGGYVINAQVKNIASGAILAHVNSTGLAGAAPAREYVATSRGFEQRERPPEIRRIASDLSLAVMDALGSYWR
jgi:hypothetical protein